MSTLRYDPAHRPGPARTGRPRRRTAGNWPSPAEGDAGKAWGMGCEPRSLLSVVVPARNEAAGLPQLIDEVARALRPLRDGEPRRLAGFEIIIVDDGLTDRTPEVLKGLAADYPELKGMVLPARGGSIVGDRGGYPGRPGRLDRDAGRRFAERPGRPGAALGGPARPRRRPGMAGGSPGRLVAADHQPVGEPGAQWRAGPVDPRHGVFGPDLPPGGGLAPADVPRRAPVLRAAPGARGVPAGAGAGRPSSPPPRPIALQPVEPVDPGGR